MVFEQTTPRSPLNLLIDNYVYYNGFEVSYKMEKLLPDGTVNIVINLTGNPKNIYGNEDLNLVGTFKKGLIAGIHKDYITKDSDGDSEMIVIQFKPGGAFPFFNFPLSELTGKIIELDEIWGRKFWDLREKLSESPTPKRCFNILDNYFIKQLKRDSIENPFIKYAVDAIKLYPAVFAVKRLTQKIGYSQKHLIDIFKKEVGVSPKLYMRLVRFQRVIQQIENQKEVDWSEIALSAGFYDQSHFANEFKRFCGMNPTTYLSSRGSHLNYIPIE